MSAEKVKDLMAQVNATLGKNVLTLASADDYKVEYVPSGLLPVDILLQGGIPRGRFIEIYGDYSTLKSYVGYSFVKQFQDRGMTAAVIDFEHSFEESWARSIGIDVDSLIIIRPETGEQAMDALETLIRGEVDFVLYDSVAATQPQTELKKRLENETVQPARLAQLMSLALRRITAANKKTSVMFINQTRLNIGVVFGSNEAVPGGKALPFYASYRVSMRRVGKVTRDFKSYNGEKWETGKEQIGQKYKAEVTKSKLSKPFRDIWFVWNLNNGQIDIPTFVFAQGVENGLINQKGNTWTYKDLKAVGREKFITALSSDAEALHDLENDVRRLHGISEIVTVEKSLPKSKARAPRKVAAKKK